jgi:hypothetical protein
MMLTSNTSSKIHKTSSALILILGKFIEQQLRRPMCGWHLSGSKALACMRAHHLHDPNLAIWCCIIQPNRLDVDHPQYDFQVKYIFLVLLKLILLMKKVPNLML